MTISLYILYLQFIFISVYRSGFVYLELEDVPAGTYHIIPATYVPGQEGPFFLICKSSCNLQLQLL